MTSSNQFSNSGSHLRKLLWASLVVALLFFIVRGPGRGVRQKLTDDYFGIYTSAKAWIAGEQPYSTPVFVRVFEESSGYKLGENTLPLAEKYTALPGTIPFAAPLSLLSWNTANRLWVLAGCFAYISLLVWIALQSRQPIEPRLIFLICSFALGCVHTGLSGANVTPLLVGLLGMSWLLHQRGHWIVAGILLGMVACSKPHIAGAMVLWLFVQQQWRTFLVGVATGVASLAIFAGRLAYSGAPWLHDFFFRVRQFGEPGGPDDFSLANPARYQLLNLQVIFGTVLQERLLVNLAAFLLGAVFILLWWKLASRRNVPALLSFAAINVILMLPTYHRYDDASVLVFLFAAVLMSPDVPRLRTVGVLTAIIFFLPYPTILLALADRGLVSSSVIASPATQLTLLTMQAWFLLFLSVALLLPMRGAASSTPSRSGESPTHYSIAT